MGDKPTFKQRAKCEAAPKKNSSRVLPCQQIALENGRCYYHGGRRPTHGRYTQAIINQKRDSRRLIKSTQKSLDELKGFLHD